MRRFEFPNRIELSTTLNDIINFEEPVDDVYYYREGRQPFYDTLSEGVTDRNSVYQWRRQYVRENKSGVVPTLTANMGTGGHNVPIILSNTGIRKLTPREAFNVQGFPKIFKLPSHVAKSHLYKQAGNSVSVPVIKRIAINIAKALNNSDELDEIKINNSDRYAIVYKDIHGRYSGSSKLIATFRTLDEVEEFKNNDSSMMLYLNEDEYTHLIKKGISEEFYVLVNI